MSASEATRKSISARSKCVRLSMVSRSDGSASATPTLFSCLKTGTTRYLRAMCRGMVAMTSSAICISLRLTTSAPKCAALACVTSAGRTTLLATSRSTNPAWWGEQSKSGLIEQVRRAALLFSGPIRLALLAAAMLAVLRILRKYGFPARPTFGDWAVSGIVCMFTLSRFGEACAASLAGRQISHADWISMAGLPILCVLSMEAMLLRRSVARMGSGLISRGWVALGYGILLTVAGEVVLWVLPHYSQTLPLAMVCALMPLTIGSLFALVPAYQLVAQRRAMRPAGSQPEDLPAGIPELAQ